MSESGCSSSVTFKKINTKKKFVRKHQETSSDSDNSNEDKPAVVRIERKRGKLNPNVHSSAGHHLKRKSKINKDASSSTSSSNSDNDDSAKHEFGVSYKSTKNTKPLGPSDQGATATNEVETEQDRDAQAIFEKSLQVNKNLEGKADDKIYRGINNYAQYYKKKDTAAGNASSGLVRKGPIRAPAHLRATVRWDYQPDICKDYKETGYCGFGDSCKFLHDRSDYKAGWQLELDHNAEQKGEADSDGDDTKYEIHSDEESLPFKCFICRGSFTDPIVTKCKHYFCEKCALENFKKSTRCFVCSIQTNGVFKPAKDLMARLNNEAKGGEVAAAISDSDDSD